MYEFHSIDKYMKAIVEKCIDLKMHKSRIQRLFRSKIVILLDIKNTSLADFNIFWAGFSLLNDKKNKKKRVELKQNSLAEQALKFKMDRLDRTILPRTFRVYIFVWFTNVWMQYIYTSDSQTGGRRRLVECLPWHRNLCKSLYLRLKDDMYWLQQQIAMRKKTTVRKKMNIVDYQTPMALYFISIGFVHDLIAQKNASIRDHYATKKNGSASVSEDMIQADILHLSNFRFDYYRDMPLGAERIDIDYTPQGQPLYRVFIDTLNQKKSQQNKESSKSNFEVMPVLKSILLSFVCFFFFFFELFR
ncbi:hypothetical protein RFI_06079, partial [Reticulomyxa filosa]